MLLGSVDVSTIKAAAPTQTKVAKAKNERTTFAPELSLRVLIY